MIGIEGLSREWEGFALRDISLDVKKGEYFVILGPTGSGKTLLLEVLAGFHYPDKGSVRIDGRDVTALPPRKRGIGFVYQDHMLFPHLNVQDNIAFGLRVKGMHKVEARGKAKELAARFGIDHLLDRSPATLSGGEAQRTALARALAIEPDILLFDEPLSALDPHLQSSIREDLRRMHRATGATIIHVTHSREEAMVLGDRMAVMNEGRLVQVGTPMEVFRSPRSMFVAEFVGVGNILKGTASREGGVTSIRVGSHIIQSSHPARGEVHASIRPEDIIISMEEVHTSARNNLRGKVSEIVDTGTVMNVSVDCDPKIQVFVTRESCEEMGIGIGREVNLMFKAQNVNVF